MSSPDPLLGQIFYHYRIVEKLDRGRHGRGVSRGRPGAFALCGHKVLPDNLPHDQQASERFLREARSAAALNHPNICTIYEFGEHAGRRFLVMELLEGETLKQRINGRALDIRQILEIGAQISDALDAAHNKGIIHRDIKPANIFITTRSQAKLLDFGLAKQIVRDGGGDQTLTSISGDLTTAGSTLGTIAYMSPEQALGRELDARSDIFSLGLVFYEMATGKQAFAGVTTAQIFDGILNRTPPAPSGVNPDVPAELNEVITKCLEKIPDARPSSAR